eukprot:TRINITY_DN1110_c0_g5_i1.p1 TRINITY_DN1110_c0_g5~~TRINITY_DN1110_c0_g5_i1.p1  ORF type:complete len:340 (+),score=68.27 TRINITY_DN1110_c0_g5_i1:60-1079(+)
MQHSSVLMTVDDGSLPGSIEEQQNLLKFWHEYNLDKYYHIIYPHTFATSFINLSLADVKCIQNHLRTGVVDPQIQKIYDELEAEIQKFGRSAFVRLSTRSPKDAVDKLSKIQATVIQELHKIFPDQKIQTISELDEEKANLYLIALKTAFFNMMKVTNAKEAFDLFMYSSRTVSDIRRVLSLSGVSEFSVQIVVREFIDIPLEGEFRGFVAHNQLNALSQYYTDCYFKHLAQNPEPVIHRIVEFFHTIIQPMNIPYEKYIMDFAVTQERVYVVEINPFGENTGSALYSWKDDLKILTEGPFSYRVVQSPSSPITRLSVWTKLFETKTETEVESKGCVVS